MKRPAALVLVAAALVAAALPASAAKAPKPVQTTLYFHGTQPVSEASTPEKVNGTYDVMDATAPTGTSAKSAGVTHAGATPNPACSGSPLFPTWAGDVAGTPTGDAVVELHLASAGTGKMLVRLFNDVGGLSCNDAYVPPIGQATVDVVNGQTVAKVVLKGINPKKRKVSSLTLMVSPETIPSVPFFSRISYDATTAMSKLTFSCVPKSGTSCA